MAMYDYVCSVHCSIYEHSPPTVLRSHAPLAQQERLSPPVGTEMEQTIYGDLIADGERQEETAEVGGGSLHE